MDNKRWTDDDLKAAIRNYPLMDSFEQLNDFLLKRRELAESTERKCNKHFVSITEGELCEICNQNEAKVIYKTCYKCEEYIINGEHN